MGSTIEPGPVPPDSDPVPTACKPLYLSRADPRWLLGAGRGWALAALLIGAVIPFTLIGIMPTNKALLKPGRDLETEETRALLGRWANLHAVRTLLGLAAALWYVYLALNP